MRILHFALICLLIPGNVFLSSCKKSEAERSYEKGVRLSQKGHYQSAIKHYTRSIKKDPKNVRAIYERGVAREATGYLWGAHADFSRAIKLESESEHTTLFIRRGTVLLKLKKYKKAIKDFTVAIKLNPNDRQPYLDRALARHSLGNLKGACRDWRAAHRLGFKNAKDMIEKFCK